MGIKRIELYEFSEHAEEQLKMRFKTLKNNWKNWLMQFNMDAELSKTQQDGTQIWQSGEVGMVINPTNHVIVTVYHIFANDFPDDLKYDLARVAKELRMQYINDYTSAAYKAGSRLGFLAFGSSEEDAVNFYETTVQIVNDLKKITDYSEAYMDGLNQLIAFGDGMEEEDGE